MINFGYEFLIIIEYNSTTHCLVSVIGQGNIIWVLR